MKLKDKTLTIRDNIKLHLGGVDHLYLQHKTFFTCNIDIVPKCIEFVPFDKYANLIPLSSSSTGVSSHNNNNRPMRGMLFFISEKLQLTQLIIYKERQTLLTVYGDVFANMNKPNEMNKVNNSNINNNNVKQTLKFFHVVINTTTAKACVIYGTQYTLYKSEIDFLEVNNNSNSNRNDIVKSTIIFDVSSFQGVSITNVYFPNHNNENENEMNMYVQIGNNMIFVINYNQSCDIMMNTQIIKGIVIDKKTKKMPVNIYTVNYSSKLNNNFYLQNKYISLQDIRNSNIIYYLQIDLIKVNYKNNKISSSTYIDTYIHSMSVSSTKIIAINLFSGQILLFEELSNSPPWLLSYYLISPNQSSSLIFSSDNNLLAIGTQDNNVYIIDILTKKPLACLVGHCNYIKYIYFEDNSNEIRNTNSFLRLSSVTKNNQIRQVKRDDLFEMWKDNEKLNKQNVIHTQFSKEINTTQNNKSQWEKYSLCTIGLDGYIGSYEIHRGNDDDDEDNNNDNNVHNIKKFQFSKNGNKNGNNINEYICNIEGPQYIVLNEQRMRMLNIDVINPIYMNKDILKLPIIKFWKSNDYLFIIGVRNKRGSEVLVSFFDKQEIIQNKNINDNDNPFKKKENKNEINVDVFNKKYSLNMLNLENIGINIESINAELKQSSEIVIKQSKDI